MGILNGAAEWLVGQMQTAAGVSITYAPIGGTATTPTAWVGRQSFVSESTGVRVFQWGDRDYLVLASDLSGQPKLGDRITESIGGVSHTFEVETPSSGEHHWRWSDQGRTIYRIHVKRKNV